ncbi:MAG TPA: hypothetical protein VEX86_23440 [Longimicrobium sp.]|nr:hypothetical protein [Longimicrobium sp.]
MKKLTLDLDSLAIETFSTDAVEGTGTVAANSGTIVGTYPCSEIDACPSAPAGC